MKKIPKTASIFLVKIDHIFLRHDFYLLCDTAIVDAIGTIENCEPVNWLRSRIGNVAQEFGVHLSSGDIL